MMDASNVDGSIFKQIMKYKKNY